MKKSITFYLFCVIFALISVSVCVAEEEDGLELEPEEGYLDVEWHPQVNAGAEATTGADAAAVSAASAAEFAAAAQSAAADAAESAAAAAAAADTATAAADSFVVIPAVPAVVPPPPQSQPPQLPPPPPVRIYIPMAGPAGQVPPPAAAPAPPPVVIPVPAPRRPINVIPVMPDPYGNGVYRVQVGAFANTGLAQQCFDRVRNAGLFPYYEPYGSMYRVVIVGVRAADMPGVVQRLDAAGFTDVWLREER